MKIFDWVHRRFAHKERSAEGGKKSCVIDYGDGENSYVHDSNALNMFDGWKEGILTIGTLGYDPLKDEAEQQRAEQENDSDGGEITDSDDEEEANPLVYAAAAAAAAYTHDCEALLETKGEASNRVNEEFDFESEFDAMIMSIPKKERITLAELFSADSEMKLLQKKKLGDQKLGEVVMNKDNKHNSNKHGFSFAKKLIGDKDARPIQKLHRLMRMMLKRKIHPDEVVNKQNGGKSSNICSQTSTETASLLPAQVADAII